jgi:nucleotide-binding universal stress UspA family protein
MKIPRLEHGANPINIIGFEAEQMILPTLSGPHAPYFVAAGDLHQPYIVMELIAGRSLKDCLPRLPLPVEEVAAIGAKVAAALHDIHRQDVIHLDVKPSNVMIRHGGEAALIDFGFSHHARLPDLVAEEFPGPVGTGAYIAPEQILGDRSDARSDIFALGVLMYFFATGERPFGDPQSVGGWRRRLTRAPLPPRVRRPDCPPWLQEVILRCLETEPARRHPTAAQLAFDLQHPGQIAVTARGERTRRTGMMRAAARWLAGKRRPPLRRPAAARQLHESPIVMAAIALSPGTEDLAEALRVAVRRVLQTHPDARLICVNVLKLSRLALDPTEDEQGRNLHLRRLAELQYWASTLPAPAHGITYHVVEAADPAAALLDFARNNHVDHIVMGARASSALRRYLGSISARVVAEAPCTVTVVRLPRSQGSPRSEASPNPAS